MGSSHLWLWIMFMECAWVGPGSRRERTTRPLLSGQRNWDYVQELEQEEKGVTSCCQDPMRIRVLFFWVHESRKLPRSMVEEFEEIQLSG